MRTITAPVAVTATTASASTVATIAIPTVPPVALVAARFGLGQQAAALGQVENLALIQPRLDPDHAVGGMRFGKSIIDIRPQGVQRQLPLQIPFAARAFSLTASLRT